MPDIAFVNDRFMPLAQARVSVEDRGFQFGDGVYELLRVYGGVPFLLESHLARLERSARALRLSLPFTFDRWTALVSEAVRQSGYVEAKVYIQITRGASPRDHGFSPDLPPTTVVTVREMISPPSALYRDGASVVTVPDIRWGRCDIKSIGLLANVLAKQQAREAGAFEALFVRDGFVMEGATSNVVAVSRGVVMTPPEGPLLLSGVTRMVTLSLARDAGLPVKETPLSEDDLSGSEEVFLTGTTIEILPVVRVNACHIGVGIPGAVTACLMSGFRKLHT